MACPVEVNLTQNPVTNATEINNLLAAGSHVRIPKGSWPVRPILLPANCRISGCGIGVAQLVLEVDSANPPSSWEDTNVLRAIGNNISVNDLTINGNRTVNDFSNVNAGDAYRAGMGLYIDGAAHSFFSNLQIKSCWSDGLFINFTDGASTPADSCIFNDLQIVDCERNGIGLFAGENISLSNLEIRDIGQSGRQEWPRAGIDMTPQDLTSAPAASYVRNICVSGCRIRDAGQGILVRGDHSQQPVDGLIIGGVDFLDLKGNQFLYLKKVSRLAISNVSCRNFDATTNDPSEAIAGLMIEDSVGVISNVDIDKVTYLTQPAVGRYPLVIFGDETDMQMSNVLVHDCTYGALQIGVESGVPDTCSVDFSDFVFRNLMGATGAQIIVANSTGTVKLSNGLVREPGNAAQTVNLQTDVMFEGCDFDAGQSGNIFLFATDGGKAIGSTSNWNRFTYEHNNFGQYALTRENVLHVEELNTTVAIQLTALWDGNEVLIRDTSQNATQTIQVLFPGSSGEGPDTIDEPLGTLLLRCDGTKWFSNKLPVS